MRRGLSRLKETLEQMPVSKTTWQAGVKEGRFPPPVNISKRCPAWRNSDLDELEALLAAGKDWRDHKASL